MSLPPSIVEQLKWLLISAKMESPLNLDMPEGSVNKKDSPSEFAGNFGKSCEWKYKAWSTSWTKVATWEAKLPSSYLI